MTKITERFKKFHHENPHIYELFKKMSYQAKAKGFSNIGAQFIGEVMRWESGVKTTGDIFKINNDYLAYYARMVMDREMGFKGFFRTRKVSKL